MKNKLEFFPKICYTDFNYPDILEPSFFNNGEYAACDAPSSVMRQTSSLRHQLVFQNLWLCPENRTQINADERRLFAIFICRGAAAAA